MFTICACKSGSDPTSPGDDNGSTITIPGLGIFPTFGVTNLKGLLMVFYDQTTDAGSSASAIGVFLGSTSSQLVYAGEVQLNGNVIDTVSVLNSVVYSDNSLLNVTFDGSPHDWVVSGSGVIAAFSGSVQSPNGNLTLTSPFTGEEISRNQPLTVTWGNAGTDSVLVLVSDSQGHLLQAISTTGTHTFTATQMGTLSAGSGFVEVDKYKYAVQTVGGNNYVLYSAVVDDVSVTLN